ncbi:MAG: putative Ig domain-containing protein [Maribacter sp.]
MKNILTLCLFLVTCQILKSQGIIQNGSFETGSLNGWVIWENNGTASISNDASQGTYAASITNGEAVISQSILVESNKNYKLTFDSKLLGSDQAWIVVKDYAGSGTQSGYQATSSNYSTNEIEFSTSSGINTIKLDIWKDGANGTLLVDNFQLAEIPQDMKLVSEPDTSVQPNASYSYTVSTTNASGQVIYSTSVLPDWLDFNFQNGTLSGTPTLADLGNHSIEIKVRDSQTTLKLKFVVTVDDGSILKVLPLGNSITEGEDVHASYRRVLWNELKDDGYNIDFVGSKFFSGFFDLLPPEGDLFDMHHEGHSGWDTNNIISGAGFDPGRGTLSTWLNGYTPDAVLLHLGTNDVFNCRTNSQVLSDMDTIISLLRADNPNVVIFLAKIVPMGNSSILGFDDTYCNNGQTLSQMVTSLNNALTSYVPTKDTPHSPVILVDQNSNISVTADMYDGIHPNGQGEEKMAQKWFDAIQNHFGTPPNITSSSPGQTVSRTTGQNFSYQLTANDSDSNDVLTYSAPNLPSWLSFNSSSGLLTGTPNTSNIGKHKVTLRVSDGTFHEDLKFFIKVKENRGPNNFYVSNSGNDSNPGTQSQPWRNGYLHIDELQAGDALLYRGGQNFSETLIFDESFNTSASQPLKISSYGSGRATLKPVDDSAIIVKNNAGFEITNINAEGTQSYNDFGGITFRITEDFTGTKDYVLIENVEVSDFYGEGIFFGGFGTGKITNITVRNVESHHNVFGGMVSYAAFAPDYNFVNMLIEDCHFHDNYGDPLFKENHSGNGVVIGSAQNLTIQRCIANDNGGLNTNPQGGPVGIWAFESKDVIIQHNEAYANKTGNSKDGGGFDIDGGCIDCTLQYNYSHGNDGAGYLIAQFDGATPLRNSIIRYNISENDGRNNNFGGIHLFSSGSSGGVVNADIYNNTIYVNTSSIGIPKAVEIESGGFTNINFHSNIFVTNGSAEMMKVVSQATGSVAFQGNLYYSANSNYTFSWGNNNYSNYSSWQNGGNQERISGNNVGLNANPQLNNAGAGITLGDPYLLESFDGYDLQNGSPAIDEGLDLNSQFSINIGAIDFKGTQLNTISDFDMGAVETSLALMPPTLNSPSVTEFREIDSNWSSVGNATGYIIKYGTSSGNYNTTIDVGNVLSYNVDNLLDNEEYFFVAVAYNVNDESGNSNQFSAMTLTPNAGNNMSFELNNFSGWTLNNSGSNSFYTQNINATDGSYNGLVWNGSNHSSLIYQDINGIPNGTYSVSMDAASGSGFSTVRMEVSNYGGGQLNDNLTQNVWYQELKIENINVTNNSIRIGFRANGSANSWAVFDNFQLIETSCPTCRGGSQDKTDDILTSSFSSEITLYPNPSHDFVHISFEAPQDTKGIILVHDNLGRTVKRIENQVKNGHNDILINLQELTQGIYFIDLKNLGVDGSKTFIKR